MDAGGARDYAVLDTPDRIRYNTWMGIYRTFSMHPSTTRGTLAAALAAAAISFCGLASAAPVDTTTVRGATQAGAFELDGGLQPVRQSTVAAQVSGNVVQLAVKAGDRVRAGQVIARIDERDTQAGLARSEAAVTQATAEERNARLSAERARELRARGFVSQAALDTAETQFKAAQAGVQQAQAARSQAALARGFAVVTAPFDALVLATHVEAGDLATPGRGIATLYAPAPLRAVVQVPASRAAIARSARTVEVRMPSGEWIAPMRGNDLPGADPVSQTVEWRLDLPASATTGAIPGQSVRVRFAGAETGASAAPAAPIVPVTAVLRRGELTAVYVVQGERFALRAVRTGAQRPGGMVEVLAGLRTGDRIATDAVRAGLSDATPAAARDASR